MRGPPVQPPRFGSLFDALANASKGPYGLTFIDLRERETFYSWKDLWNESLRVAAGLRALGIEPGDRVAIIMRTSPQFVTTFFGALGLGAIPVPLYPPVRLARMEEYQTSTTRMLRVSGSNVVVADWDIRILIGEAVGNAQPPRGCCTHADLLRSGEIARTVDVEPEALALIQFSSGSTVAPKPIALSHHNILMQLSALEQLLEPTPGKDFGVSWLPLYHDLGLIGCLLWAAYVPGPLALIAPEHFLARPALWLRALSRHRGTLSVAPNFAYSLCTNRISRKEAQSLDLSRWRLALCGAEPVSPSALEAFARKFSIAGFKPSALRSVYGLSEASLGVTIPAVGGVLRCAVDRAVLASTGKVRPGSYEIASVGTPIPGTEVEVRNENGRAKDDGQLGRIYVRGPCVLTEYFQQPGETNRARDADGWLDTGDLGFTRDGNLYVHGRAKDVVIVNGANHAAHEFEECLTDLPGLRAGCAVAVGARLDNTTGEQLIIFAETLGRRLERLEESIAHEVAVATGVTPARVILLEPGSLPRTSSGKMRRAEALRRWLAGELRPGESAAVNLVKAIARGTLALRRLERTGGL